MKKYSTLLFILKYKWAKFIYRRRKIKSLSPIQETAEKIFMNLIGKSDAVLNFSPISEERNIQWKDIFIFLNYRESSIIITNHKYHYIINLPVVLTQKLVIKYDNALDRRTQKIIEEQTSNIYSSISDILNDIKN